MRKIWALILSALAFSMLNPAVVHAGGGSQIAKQIIKGSDALAKSGARNLERARQLDSFKGIKAGAKNAPPVSTFQNNVPHPFGQTIVPAQSVHVTYGDEALSRISKRFELNKNYALDTHASSASTKIRLQKQLASEEQMGQLAKGNGTIIDQPAKQANRIASETGYNPVNIQKVSSDAFTASDGQKLQIHAFRNKTNNKIIEPKTIINYTKK